MYKTASTVCSKWHQAVWVGRDGMDPLSMALRERETGMEPATSLTSSPTQQMQCSKISTSLQDLADAERRAEAAQILDRRLFVAVASRNPVLGIQCEGPEVRRLTDFDQYACSHMGKHIRPCCMPYIAMV